MPPPEARVMPAGLGGQENKSPAQACRAQAQEVSPAIRSARNPSGVLVWLAAAADELDTTESQQTGAEQRHADRLRHHTAVPANTGNALRRQPVRPILSFDQ